MAQQRVMITAAADGIGKSIAHAFAAEGAKVHICDVNEAALDQFRKEFPDIAASKVNVRSEGEVDAWFDDALDDLGGLDVLICNAGISIRHGFVDIPREEFDRVLRVNVLGVFYVSQLAARHMLAQDNGGAILMTASTSGVTAYRYYADYNASKGALLAMMRTMAIELAPKVRVNAVNPGYTMTPMQEAEYSPEMLAQVNGIIPMKRHARPEEIAALYVYLASDEAGYATGAVFTLDGAESVASGAAYL